MAKKGMNIDLEIHKMLKLQSLLTGENMTDIAERAILGAISKEVKDLVNSSNPVINKILSNSTNRKNSKDETEKVKYEETDEIISNRSEKITDERTDIVTDKEMSCYL